MNNIDNWNEELPIKTAISNIIDLETRYFMLQDRINKAIEYIKDNHVSVTQLESGTGLLDTKFYLLEILTGDNND